VRTATYRRVFWPFIYRAPRGHARASAPGSGTGARTLRTSVCVRACACVCVCVKMHFRGNKINDAARRQSMIGGCLK